jgi:hypothetical protein
MCVVVADAFGLFLMSLVLHVVAWRIRRPESYRAWLPLLIVIFGVVPVIGYTLISAFSPSVELLKLLDRTPGGVPIAELQLPFVAGGLTTERIDNLTAAELVRRTGPSVTLGEKGVWLSRMVLVYRHAIGLPDSGGG